MRIRSKHKVGLPRKALGFLVTGLMLASLIVVGSPVSANPGHNFEIDGNTAQDVPPANDWETVILDTDMDGMWDDGPGVLIQDPHSKATTDPDIFKPSGKFGEPENWSIQSGSVGPAQNELTNIYVYAITPSEQTNYEAWMIMGMHRTKKQGTFDLDFELNQVPWTDTSTGPVRTEGDIAVGFELSGNPTDPLADLYVLILRYDPTSTGNNTSTGEPYVEEYGAGWWVVLADYATAFEPEVFEATMNGTPFPAPPWGALDASGNPVDTVEPFFFAEAALNLTALGIDPGCPGFGSVHAKSRSSLEITSDLKDLAGPVSLDIDCYIFGNKYEDMDADGDISEDTDHPLEGWTINLYLDDGDNSFDAGDTLVATTMTDADGYYKFSGLEDGVYHIQEVLESGWTQSYPPAPGIHENVTVDIYNTIQGPFDFGNYQPATKSGRKFEDLNADGDDEGGADPGIGGWEIRAYEDLNSDGILDQADYDGGIADSDSTDGSGNYELTLDPGDYIIVEVLQADWTQSYPGDDVVGAVTTGGETLGEYGYAITLTSGGSDDGNDFGNWTTGTKSGTKYDDPNGDGDLSDGTPLNDWEIRAYEDLNSDGILDQADYDGGIADSDSTDGSGNYELTLDPGDYIIVEVLKTNWLQSYPGDDVVGAVTTGGETLGEFGYAITVTSRSTDTGNDFGNYQSADLEVAKSGMITYTVTVTNNGPSTAFNVVVDDDLPGNLAWTIQAPVPAGFSIVGNHLQGVIASLASGDSVEVTVEAVIPEGNVDGALLPNTATASSDTPDPDTGNNSADADIGPLP